MKKYRVVVILEECEEDCIESGCCEEDVDFAQYLGTFDNLSGAAKLIRKITAETAQNLLLIKAVKTLKKDAEMALDGRWDKADAGFLAQINLINAVLQE